MNQAAILESLRVKIKGLERSIADRPALCISSSFTELDALLPGGGLALGSIVEVLQSSEGTGAFTLALKLASTAIAAKGGTWAVLDTDRSFYPLGALPLGLSLDKLLLIRTEPRHAAWAFNQLLRCPELGACFMNTPLMDNMTFRRFQLAAERGGGLGFVIRESVAARKPCWASLRLRIADCGMRIGTAAAVQSAIHRDSVEPNLRRIPQSAMLLHVRGGKAGQSVVLNP